MSAPPHPPPHRRPRVLLQKPYTYFLLESGSNVKTRQGFVGSEVVLTATNTRDWLTPQKVAAVLSIAWPTIEAYQRL